LRIGRRPARQMAFSLNFFLVIQNTAAVIP
jgi:hypothetical protein